MPTHNSGEEHGHNLQPIPPEGSPGYETTDVNVQGVLVFLTALGVFLAVFFVFCFGMGKVINNAIAKNDGPANKWNADAQAAGGKRENMTPSPVIAQRQLQQLTQRFPTPRLQSDDGNQEVADLHAREDLLLEHYTWVDRQQGKVRIPIERAMELIAARGLPVAPAVAGAPLLTADTKPQVTVPLTDGFARTGYEQEVIEARRQQVERGGAEPAALKK